MMARKPRRLDHRPLLDNPLVRPWHDENRLRSARTADVNLRQLGLCLHEIELDPAGLLAESQSDPPRLRRRLVQYATGLQARGRLNSYIAKTFVGVASFLRHNEVEFRGFPRLRVTRGESIENERVPTQEELGLLLRALPIRGQVTALLMGHSGLRPGTFAVYRSGDVALRLGDLPDLDLERLQFRAVPFLIRVPGPLSKNRRAYVTFGTQELANTLVAYLKERLSRPRSRKGTSVAPETLSGESPLVAVRDTETETGFVTVKAVTAELRNAIEKVVPSDTGWRPYVLRSYASTQLLLAESNGKITRDFREAILGHDLGVSGRYNLSKKLQPTMVEEMRVAYKRCEPFLSTFGAPQDSASERYAALLQLLARNGVISPTDADALATGSVEELTEKLKPTRAAMPEKRREKAVPTEDGPRLLDAGWEYVGPLGSMVVLRAPSVPSVPTLHS